MDRPFLVLAANTPWVYALAQSLCERAPVTAVQFYDAANARRLRPVWPEEASPVRRRRLVLPPGYAGRLEPVFRPLLRRTIDAERARLRSGGVEPVVVAPYPYLAPWVRDVPADDLVYFNLDDYELYEPWRAARIRSMQDELIARAGLTVCLSAYQAQRLGRRHPSRRHRIAHFPLGVVRDFIQSEPATPPLPRTVGYVGNLGDRVDWPLVAAVAARLPDVAFHFVGFAEVSAADNGVGGWQRARRDALALANVVHVGGVPQARVREHYWRYSVNWMPYAADHPFNRASCPTKIMDALASGRPFVATPVPEAQLYPEHVTTASGADAMAAALAAALGDPGDPAHRIAFAAGNTWSHRAEALRRLVAGDTATVAEVAA